MTVVYDNEKVRVEDTETGASITRFDYMQGTSRLLLDHGGDVYILSVTFGDSGVGQTVFIVDSFYKVSDVSRLVKVPGSSPSGILTEVDYRPFKDVIKKLMLAYGLGGETDGSHEVIVKFSGVDWFQKTRGIITDVTRKSLLAKLTQRARIN